jgi:hypothetical protein
MLFNLDETERLDSIDRANNKHAGSAKQFLNQIDLRSSKFSKVTMRILRDFSFLKLPEIGEQIRIRTQRQLNLVSLLLKIVEVHQEIDELTIATYTLNREAYEATIGLLKNGRVKKLNLILASSISFRNPTYYRELKEKVSNLARNFDVHLTFVWCHFKITLAKCGENFYQHEGSMNYSMNNMAEQILLENNRETYDYDYDFLNRVMTGRESNKATEVIC